MLKEYPITALARAACRVLVAPAMSVLAAAFAANASANSPTWVSSQAYGCGCRGAVFKILGNSREDVCTQAAAHATSCGCLPPQHPNTPSVFSVVYHTYTPPAASGSCYIEDLQSAGSTWAVINYSSTLAETHPPQPPCSASPRAGNPITPLTGAKTERIGTNFAVGGIELELAYDTTARLPTSQSNANTLLELPAFGPLWRSNLHGRLVVATGQKAASLLRGDGSITSFTGNGVGVFTAAAGHAHKLESISGGYRFSDNATNDLSTFDANGRLLTLALADGKTLSFAYSGENLTRVVANDGRMLRFIYGNNGRVSQIVGPDARSIDIGYDAGGNLSTLTWSNAKVLTLLYENPTFPWALTGKVDENNSRHATFVYDASGRAISTEYAGGVQKYSVSYGAPPIRQISETYDSTADVLYRTYSWNAPAGIALTQPNGQTIAFDAQVVAGMPVLTQQSQPAGSGCAASARGMAYDASGNLLSRDDFDARRTCYAYDSRRRETVRVEGLSASTSCASVIGTGATIPPGARKITTNWHPDWAMPVEVTEPLRKVTTVHHGQPDASNGNAAANCSPAPARSDGKPLPLVCKTVAQALHATGAVNGTVPARATHYTYDAAGRVLTSVNPKGQSTTHAYYTATAFTGAQDPHFARVSLLLHGNGTSGSTAVEDSGPVRQGVSVAGDAKISTTKSKFGGAALAFDGAGDYLSIPSSSEFDLGAQDFTIELWINTTQTTAYAALLSREWGAAPYSGGFTLFLNHGANGPLSIYWADYSTSAPFMVGNATTQRDGTWRHIAWTRNGNVHRLFDNGVQVATVTAATAFASAVRSLTIGNDLTFGGGARAYNGYIDDLRITKGVARYTANFTPPAQEAQDAGPGMAETGHTAGDLQSVTNAMGHVTTFNAYDPAGRVRQMTDAKGVVTDVTYTPRGRVSTVTTTPPGGAARTTTYTYDSVGQLTQVSQPDGTSLSYSYDAAHRLTGVTDARGNAVSYTLDNAGNRIGEEVRDPTGTLQRSIARSFDALNRLQQAVGAPR